MSNENRSVRIQPATPDHLPEIAALAEVVWRAHYPGIITHEQIDYMLPRMYGLDVLRKELTQGTVYVRGMLNGALKGFASYGPLDSGEMKLYKLYIHPEVQRQGLGSMLLHHVEQKARERGSPVLLLTVNKGNTSAISAYRKNGFTVRETAVVDIGGGFVMDDFIMVKRMAA